MARKLPIVIEAIFLALQKPVYNGKKFARAKALMRPSCVRVHKWTSCTTYVCMCILNNKKKKEKKKKKKKKRKKKKRKARDWIEGTNERTIHPGRMTRREGRKEPRVYNGKKLSIMG